MYFINEQHKKNYHRMLERFPVAWKDTEYQSACYISAVPMVFHKFQEELNHYDAPLDWIINWQMKYVEKEDYETEEDYQERINISVNYDLTLSMQELGKLALNLFNGYDYFNLMDCLSRLDDDNIRVLKTAIDVRLGAYK